MRNWLPRRHTTKKDHGPCKANQFTSMTSKGFQKCVCVCVCDQDGLYIQLSSVDIHKYIKCLWQMRSFLSLPSNPITLSFINWAFIYILWSLPYWYGGCQITILASLAHYASTPPQWQWNSSEQLLADQNHGNDSWLVKPSSYSQPMKHPVSMRMKLAELFKTNQIDIRLLVWTSYFEGKERRWEEKQK